MEMKISFAQALLEAYIKYFSQKGKVHIVVDTLHMYIQDPVLRSLAERVEDNPDLHLRLNISAESVTNFKLENDSLRFTCKFAGVPHDVYLEMRDIVAVVCPETSLAHYIDLQVVSGPEGPVMAKPTEAIKVAAEWADLEAAKAPPVKARPTLTVVK